MVEKYFTAIKGKSAKKITSMFKYTKNNKKNTNLWKKLKTKNPDGIYALAPMADVTDNPFRKILSKIGPTDVYWTEFVSADGLSHPTGVSKLLPLLNYEKKQKPIIAQIFSGSPENIKKAAVISREMKFDGIDINMGCPQRNILKQMCGSELIKKENRELAKSVIEGARKGAKNIPVSVKTRIGFNEIDLDWIDFLLQQKLPLLTIHLRTKKEMSKVPAHWELMTQIREKRDQISPDTLIFGNGDILTRKQGQQLITKHGIDGVMVGRGLFSNPWFFNPNINPENKSAKEKIKLALLHSKYFDQEFGVNSKNTKKFGKPIRSFHIMKKFYKAYVTDFKGARELRTEMMQCKNLEEVKNLVKKTKIY